MRLGMRTELREWTVNMTPALSRENGFQEFQVNTTYEGKEMARLVRATWT